MNSHEQNNLHCIKCHSLGLGDPRGFTAAKNMVNFKNDPIIDYWNKAHTFSQKVKSIRKLSSSEIRKISTEWRALDASLGIKRNFANVQCLNCHNTDSGHPFNADTIRTREEKLADIKVRCLQCHTKEQSPEWYTDNFKLYSQKLKQVSCPLSN
jgi:ribosomal protein S27E